MKANQIFSLSVETLDALRTKAAEIGVSYSALASLFLRHGLSRIPDDVLQAWAVKLRTESTNAPKPRSEQLRKSERAALSVLEAEWREFSELRAAAGQGEGVHWRALQGLERRGLATMRADSAAKDPRTGRPLQSFWRLKGGDT